MLELFLFETIVEKEKDMHPIIKKHIQLTRNVFHPNPKDEKKNTSNNTMNLKKKKGEKNINKNKNANLLNLCYITCSSLR
jgi:hypothetical protein